MVELSYLLVAAIIILQLYVCACTYWVFKKIDRYENIALSIVERYLSRRVYGGVSTVSTESAVSTESTVNTVNTLMIGDTDGGNMATGVDTYLHNETRREVTNYIQKVLYYAPERVHSAASRMMEKWYCQACIDLVCICVHHRNSIKNEMKLS